MFFIYTIILEILMKKSYLLIVALLVNSVFVKTSDNKDILGRVAVTAATLALGHVLYSQEKDGVEQRAKGHVFTPTLGKDGIIAIPGENPLFRKTLGKITDLGPYALIVAAFPAIVTISSVYVACRVGFCSKSTYDSVVTNELDSCLPLLASIAAITAGSIVTQEFMFKTPAHQLKAEYIAANPSEYLKQVKANHAWFVKDFAENISDKNTVLSGLEHCFKLNYKKRTNKEKNFCVDMRDLEKYIVNGKNS